MSKTSSAEPLTRPRADRRRERTRRRLIDAARAMLVEPGYADHAIADITEAADVGLGSFYNHFESKAELFDVAVREVLEEHGLLLDSLTADEPDVAVVIGSAIRSTARLVITNPQMARALATTGLDLLDADYGLAPRVGRVIARGVESGRFDQVDPGLLGAALGGALLGLLHRWQVEPSAVDDVACNAMTERILVMLGLSAVEARGIAYSPLPG